MQTAYLNPDNISPGEDGYFTDPAVLQRVPSVFLLLGSIYSIMQLIAIILIIPPSDEDVSATVPIVSSAVDDEDVLYQNDSYSERSPDSMSPSNLQELQLSEAAAENVKPGQVVRSSEFWILWFTFVFNTQAVGYINTMYKAFGQTFIDDDHFLAITGAVAAIFNSSGKSDSKITILDFKYTCIKTC